MTEEERNYVMQLIYANPFDRQLNYKLLEMDDGYVKMQTFTDCNICENSRQAVHGGVLFGIADTYMGTACFSMGKSVTTMGMSINYIRPTELDTWVTGIANVIHNGSKTMVTKCDFYDEEERLLAHCEGTFFVLGPVPWKEAKNVES